MERVSTSVHCATAQSYELTLYGCVRLDTGDAILVKTLLDGGAPWNISRFTFISLIRLTDGNTDAITSNTADNIGFVRIIFRGQITQSFTLTLRISRQPAT
jgi:hypothetical protein